MLWFAQGEGFDAKHESERALLRLAASGRSSDQLRAAVDMHSSLQIAVAIGFAEVIDAWRRPTAASSLFIYAQDGVVGGIKVAGDGRLNTRDITLIGMRCFNTPKLLFELSVSQFGKEMGQRLKTYRPVEWL